MARPRKDIPIEEQIARQEEAVEKAKEKYNSEVAKLKELHIKRDEAKKKELIKAIENSRKSYDEIMAFITSGNG